MNQRERGETTRAPEPAVIRLTSATPPVSAVAPWQRGRGDAEVEPLRTTYVVRVKPVLDRVLALLALLVTLPILVVVIALVLISLGRPVVFRQQRIGLGGRSFTVYKFRTMQADRRRRHTALPPERDRRRTHKHPDDPRLTRVGRLLRATSLDELPQLVNVLRGEMSLVGPRPELPSVVEQHYVAWQHRRHAVKPGVTGLWQISERGNGMMHEHVDVDLDYVDDVSLRTDLRIILRTPIVALGSRRGF